MNNDLDFVLEDETETIRVFGNNNAVSATVPMIEKSFYHFTIKRYFNIYS